MAVVNPKNDKIGLKSSFSDRFLKRILFGLLFIGHYLKGKLILPFKFLLSSRGVIALLIIFATFFSFFETELNQPFVGASQDIRQSLLAKAVNYQKMSFSPNKKEPSLKQQPSFRIASLRSAIKS